MHPPLEKKLNPLYLRTYVFLYTNSTLTNFALFLGPALPKHLESVKVSHIRQGISADEMEVYIKVSWVINE